ncbi:putative membrane protein YqjE [Anaerotaenia torta]|uniref:hypothetical protein n=1 Tax=Anaerotaenia torta TaxID=433293 RepID=UPI003D2055E2
MNKKLEKALQTAFEAPPPAHKERFLKQLPFPKITYGEFLFRQLPYIRRRVWAASALIILLGWAIAFRFPMFRHWNPDEIKIWSLSAALPFLAMITVTEVYRSAAYRMAELEGSCRFSLPQIVMARMSILGAANSVVLILLLIFANQISVYGLLQTICYLTVPYLIVCAVCLWTLNRMHGQDGVYACAAATGLVSILSIFSESMTGLLYSDAWLKGWLALSVCCLGVIGSQMRKLVKQMEDRQWNLSLTE